MTIQPGERLPEATFRVITPDGMSAISVADVFAGKKVVLFGVPGAFTPTCSANHLPGYLENADAILARGVDTIAVVAVNDPHVMNAWSKASNANGRVLFLADGNAEFTRATGLELDLGVAGMGVRCKRFSMLVDDGVVSALNIEDKPGVSVSGAAHMLGLL
ncbi:MAG: peroxiredoxin [Rhizobiaceae bacterium]